MSVSVCMLSFDQELPNARSELVLGKQRRFQQACKPGSQEMIDVKQSTVSESSFHSISATLAK